MSAWAPASSVFAGGTQQIRALVGTRVRTRALLRSVRLFDPIQGSQRTTDLVPGAVGYVSNPLGADLLVAFSSLPGDVPPSLDQLSHSGNFRVVIINEPTFKFQFDVER